MRIRTTPALVLAVAATAALALTVAAPAGAARSKCIAKAHGHKKLATSADAVVFRSRGRVRACWFASGKTYVLPDQGKLDMQVDGKARRGMAHVDGVHLDLEGQFVAYPVVWRQSHGSGRNARIFVFDLAGGKTAHSTFANDAPGIHVAALVAKPNGSVAWTYAIAGDSTPSYSLVVKMDSSTGYAEHGLDSDKDHVNGYTIDPKSLAISDDDTTIFWDVRDLKNGSRTLSAPLD